MSINDNYRIFKKASKGKRPFLKACFCSFPLLKKKWFLRCPCGGSCEKRGVRNHTGSYMVGKSQVLASSLLSLGQGGSPESLVLSVVDFNGSILSKT